MLFGIEKNPNSYYLSTMSEWAKPDIEYIGSLDWNSDEKEREFDKEACRIAEIIRDTGDFDRDDYDGIVYFDTWIKGKGWFPFSETTVEEKAKGTYIFEWYNKSNSRVEWVMLVGVEGR